jgi:multicomponent K+:H+ antiporter subunit E
MTRSIRCLVPQPLLSFAILALWLALAPSINPGQILLGAALGLAIPWVTVRFWPARPQLGRPGTAVVLFLRVVADVVIASWQVARLVLGPLDRIAPAFLEVPLDIEDPFVTTVLASIVSLTPGTVTIDIDRQRKVLFLHALDLRDEAALINAIKSRYEAPLKEVFRC